MVNHPNSEGEGLRRSEALLRTVVENMGEGVLVADLGAEVLHWNRAALRLHGFSSRQEAPLRYTDLTAKFELVSPDGGALPEEDRPLARILRGEILRDWTLRVRNRPAGWTRIFSYGGSLARDPVGRALMAVVTVRDVTDQHRLQEQLRQAEKLESVGRLAGGIAHDFNNLLTVVLSCCHALRDDLGAGRPACLEDVDEIQAAGVRASELTRQLLAFARRQVIAPVPLDLNGVVSGSERLLRRVLGEDIDLVVREQPGLWSASCDPGQMEQVIVNLAVNARDAMARGGRLVIETSNLEVRGEGGVRQPAMPAGDYVCLRVQDTGMGMAPEVQERVFEPFFTTKEPGKGTGLGLATVYGIVKQSGGFIQVESQVGRGATFELCFPRSPAPVPAAAPLPAPPARPRAGSETILLVEDNPGVRDVAARALRGAGYAVREAGSGPEGLDVARRDGGLVHLLVTDMVMPGMDGRTLASALREEQPGLRVLFVSGYAHDTVEHRGPPDPGMRFLPKPFTPAALLAGVRAVLDARAEGSREA